jgi:uncharacterized protein
MARTPEVDTIRGLALFGICVVNVPFLAQPISDLLAPPAGHDLPVRMAMQMFFEGKFFVLFSFIFGWGFAIQMKSAERAGHSPHERFLRRLLGLALIGITHAVFVFFGDILLLYVLLGLPLLLLRTASPRRLMAISAASVVVAFAAFFVLAISLGQISSLMQDGGHTAGYAGTFLDGARQRIRDWPAAFGFIVLFNGPLAFAAFCTGLAAARVGFFEPGNAVYQKLRSRLPLLLIIGLPLNALYALSSSNFLGQTVPAALVFSSLAIGGPVLGAVYLVGAVELARRGQFQGATVAAGRMSLSAYVMEGVLAGLVFNGYGLGLYGSLGATGCFLIATAIYGVTHLLASVWLTAFSRGPLEYLLRWMTYRARPEPAG